MDKSELAQLRASVGREALAKWRASKTKEELSEIGREAHAMRKSNPSKFTKGDPRAVEAGRRGGLRTRQKEMTK